MIAHQAVYAGETEFPIWLWVPAAVASLGPLWWLATLFLSGETPYDRWTNARVELRPGKRP